MNSLNGIIARENPFRTERILQVRYRLENITWEELIERCGKFRYRAAVIGPHGSGKTTFLEDLDPRLQERGFGTHFIRLDEEHPGFSREYVDELVAELGARDIILFDGAEQMNAFSWHRFQWRVRNAGGLIITMHRRGRLPTLWECMTTKSLLAGIAADLLEVERGIIQKRAERLFMKHGGNLRDALLEWYDLA